MHKQLIKLAIPNVLTNLTVPLVSMVDLALVGRFLDHYAIIAIGFGTMIFTFLYWAFGFLRMGTTGLIAQAFGKGDFQSLSATLYKSLFLALIFGLLLLISQSYLFDFAISLIEPNSVVLSDLLTYLDIRIYAAPATISIYVLTGSLLGLQDAKAALVLAATVNGLNVLGSYLLLAEFDMGIAGIAWGTVIAQYVGCGIGILLLLGFHQSSLIPIRNVWSQVKTGNWAFFRLNANLMIRTLCLIFALSFFKTYAGNAGLILGAANILLLEFISLSAYGIDGFAYAAESLSGLYFGKGLKSEFKQAVRTSFLWGGICSLCFSILFWFFGENILLLFTENKEVIEMALVYLPWLIIAPLLNALAFIWDGIFIGATESVWMRNSMLIATFCVFLPCFYLFESLFANHGIWLALSLFMVARGLIQTIVYSKVILGSFKQ